MKLIVVENIEYSPSKWLIEEYLEAHRFASSRGFRLVVSGVSNPVMAAFLESRGVEVSTLPGHDYNRSDCILLTLEAPRRLEPWEAQSAHCIIVGGIMGDHPPRGRTRLLRYSIYTAPAERSLGDVQFSIDGAVKMAILVAEGRRLDDIDFVVGVSIEAETPMGIVEVELPYGYPVIDGRPSIPRGVVELIKRGIVWDEEVALH